MKHPSLFAALLALLMAFAPASLADSEVPYLFPYADTTGCVSVHDELDDFLWTWGELMEEYGGLIRLTLTEEQRAFVRYPELDEDHVYWLSASDRYHAVHWCYTILHCTDDLEQGSVQAATERKQRTPCSKCVGAPTPFDAEAFDASAYLPSEPLSPSGVHVWVPVGGGRKYHQTATCSDMENPVKTDEAIAEAHGFTPCGRCFGSDQAEP